MPTRLADSRSPLYATFLKALVLALTVCLSAKLAVADGTEKREVEVNVYVTPGEPTQVTFPDVIVGSYKCCRNCHFVFQRQDNMIVIFAQPELPVEGQRRSIRLMDEREYFIRVLPAGAENPRDERVDIRW